MQIFATLGGAILILIVLWDAFEAIVLPRRVTHKFRLAKLFYRVTWLLWRSAARRISKTKTREAYLSFYGPLSLLFLLIVWASAMVIGFAVIHWGLGSEVAGDHIGRGFLWDLYFSGSNFFTLGLGDLTPRTAWARVATVLESGLGLGFLAMVIGYLPIIYQAFSRREVEIALLDARSGSPSAAVELLLRQAKSGDFSQVTIRFLEQWERWSSELLESHLSYPVLAYYRSQHDNQSWLGALTTVLDTCALLLAGMEGPVAWQAQLTFAMARHAIVDLSQVFGVRPQSPAQDRLPPADLTRAVEILAGVGVRLRSEPSAELKLTGLRKMYEPYVSSLSERLMMGLPPWLPSGNKKENWLTSAWEHSAMPTELRRV